MSGRIFLTLRFASAALGVVVADAWSTIAGVAIAVVIVLAGEAIRRRHAKARWIRRFPELAHHRHWSSS